MFEDLTKEKLRSLTPKQLAELEASIKYECDRLEKHVQQLTNPNGSIQTQLREIETLCAENNRARKELEDLKRELFHRKD